MFYSVWWRSIKSYLNSVLVESIKPLKNKSVLFVIIIVFAFNLVFLKRKK